VCRKERSRDLAERNGGGADELGKENGDFERTGTRKTTFGWSGEKGATTRQQKKELLEATRFPDKERGEAQNSTMMGEISRMVTKLHSGSAPAQASIRQLRV